VLAVIILFFSILAGGGTQLASAAASSYSNVLTDLTKDENFNAADYPENVKDYSLNVIQIAESVDGELFIYVYQPSGQRVDLKASSINIARSENATAEFKNYKLSLLNSNGVFYKYKVEDFELEKTDIRYYNISNILRPFDKVIDEPPADGQTVSEVPNAVGQLWTTYEGSDNVKYEASSVITVTEKYVGYVNYDDGTDLGWAMTDCATSAHFVAFSTDKPIDKLISADVSFCEREVTYQYCCNVLHANHTYQGKFNYKYGDKVQHEPDPVTITYKDKASNEGGDGVRPTNKYTWDRIRSTAEFLSDENNSNYKLTTEGAAGIDGTQWVLNFYETPIECKVDNVWTGLINGWAALFTGDADCRYTEVSDVMILRLKFEYDGDVYNLGVVDNKQTGGRKPVNEPVASGCAASWAWLNILPWWAWILIIIAVIVVIVILVKLITLPFRRRGSSSAKRNRKHKTGKKRKSGKGGKK